MPEVSLITYTPSPMNILKLAASQCYQKEATDSVIRHIVEAGHLSILEHCTVTFRLTCSLSVLLQLTRHRHLSFTVQSSRGSHMTGLHATGIPKIDHAAKSAMSFYEECLHDGIAKEEASYALPKAVHYTLLVTGNFRAWFEYLPKRLCSRTLPEHLALATTIHTELLTLCPEVFKYATPHCDTCKETRCTFA